MHMQNLTTYLNTHLAKHHFIMVLGSFFWHFNSFVDLFFRDLFLPKIQQNK